MIGSERLAFELSVWNGGVWDYCAPDPVLEAMAAANAAGQRLTLRLMYPLDPHTTSRLAPNVLRNPIAFFALAITSARRAGSPCR